MVESDDTNTVRKSLRFSEYSSLVLIKPLGTEEAQNAWYTKKEMDEFKKTALVDSLALKGTRTAEIMEQVVHSVAAGMPPKDNDKIDNKEAIRGIEHFLSPDILKMVIEMRTRHKWTVLKAQRLQKLAGSCTKDPTFVAKVSETSSEFSKEWCSRITNLQS